MGAPVVSVSDLGLRDEFVGVGHLGTARLAPEERVVELKAAPRAGGHLVDTAGAGRGACRT